MRGGQLTIFVVIGLVLLFVVALFTLMLSSLREEETPETKNQAILSSTIESCIDSIVTDELNLLGTSGGVVTFTGIPNALVDTGRGTKKILYGLTQNPSTGTRPHTYPPPRYPDDGVTINTLQRDPLTGRRFQDFQNGYFGELNFPGICAKEGLNKPGTQYTCTYPGNPPGTLGPSVQEGLTRRITNRVQACASPTAFEQATGREVQRVGTPSSTVEFTYANIIVSVTYPLNLDDGTAVKSFQRVYDVRLLPIMLFAAELAREDSRNLSFSVPDDYTALNTYEHGFVVLTSSNVAISEPVGTQSPYATLVTVLDSESSLDGISYGFNFLIEHRPPMLDPLTSTEIVDLFRDGSVPVRTGDPDDGTVTTAFCLSGDEHAICDSVPIPSVVVFDADGDMDWEVIT